MPNPGSSKHVHPLYATWSPTWRMAYDVYEGAGGFLDPDRPYLVPHPREWLDHSVTDTTTGGMKPNPNPTSPSPKLNMRRKLARYENVAGILVETVEGPLFRTPPTRSFASETPDARLDAWLANVDGLGSSLDLFLHDSWNVAAAFGHAIMLADKSKVEPGTAADTQGPMLSRYTPLDMIDWLEDDKGQLIAVKLIEGVTRTGFDVSAKVTDHQVRVVDEEKWTLYDKGGKQIDQAAHGFGRLPIVILYGRRRKLIPLLGKPIMGDPMLYIDLYNLQSEVRELLRNQTFAILNVPTGKDSTVEQETAKLGRQSGTSNVMFSTEPASFIAPPETNVAAYHEHIDRLGRMIYRLVAVPWESDSRDSESADSRKLKRADLHSALVSYTGEIQRADDTLLELAYRALFGEDGWEKARDKDEPSTSYSQDFELPDLDAVVERCSKAITLDLGETATKELKKQTVAQLLPQVNEDTKTQIHDEIDAMKVLTADEKRAEMLEASAARMGARPPMKPGEPKPPATVQ